MLTVYVLKILDDLCEGRGPYRTLATFEHERDAWIVADTMTGVQGRKPSSGSWRGERHGDVTVIPEIFAPLPSAQAYFDQQHDALKKAALNKLTPAERAALGLA